MNSIPIEAAEEISLYLEKRQASSGVVALDEAFMVEGSAEVLINLYKRGFTVLISSLQLSSHLEPFTEIKNMLPWATKIDVCPAVCTICSEDAYYTYKKTNSNSKVEIGGKELYEPRCSKHHSYSLSCIVKKQEVNGS
jgi:thymidine kinase